MLIVSESCLVSRTSLACTFSCCFGVEAFRTAPVMAMRSYQLSLVLKGCGLCLDRRPSESTAFFLLGWASPDSIRLHVSHIPPPFSLIRSSLLFFFFLLSCFCHFPHWRIVLVCAGICFLRGVLGGGLFPPIVSGAKPTLELNNHHHLFCMEI